MKKCFAIFIGLFFKTGVFAVVIPDHLIAHADSTDKSITKNHQALTDYLSSAAANDEEKVMIFSYWIAKYIRYDLVEMKWLDRSDKTPAEVLNNRKAVCEGMSNLFRQLCEDAGIICYKVTGHAYGHFVRRIFNCAHMRHAWNVVYVSGQWRLVDVTWCGSVIKTKTFKKTHALDWIFDDPEHFAKSHLPGDPRWQILKDPLSPKEFWHQEPASEKNYNYKDSLDILLNRDNAENYRISLYDAYRIDSDENEYMSNLIHLGWDYVGGNFDSTKIEKGIRIFYHARAERQRLDRFISTHRYDAIINTGISTGKQRLEGKF